VHMMGKVTLLGRMNERIFHSEQAVLRGGLLHLGLPSSSSVGPAKKRHTDLLLRLRSSSELATKPVQLHSEFFQKLADFRSSEGRVSRET